MTRRLEPRGGKRRADRLNAAQTRELLKLVANARTLHRRLLRFAASLATEPPDALPAVVRGRIEAIALDRLEYAIQDLAGTLAEVQEASKP